MRILSHTTSDLRILADKFANVQRFGMDYECSSKHPSKNAALEHDKLILVGAGFGFPDGDHTYVPVGHASGPNAKYSELLQLLDNVLNDPKLEVWAHNSKYEKIVTRAVGISDAKAQFKCSMLAQWLLQKRLSGGRGLKLKPAVKEFLGHTMLGWDDVVPKNWRAHQVSSEKMAPYCADDGLQCLRLGELWLPELDELDMLSVFDKLENSFVDVLVHMQEVGFAIDRPFFMAMHEEFITKIDELRDKFQALTKVSISSSQKVSQRLYEDLGWWPSGGFKRGKSGYFSIDKGHRAEIEKRVKEGSPGHEALLLINEFSKLAKLDSTYTHSLVAHSDLYKDGRIRSHFLQTGTNTGRLSSSAPNLQNIPARDPLGVMIRKGFRAEPGWSLIDVDYSQADLRMMAHLSQDPMLMKAYLENIDVHSMTAEACGCGPTKKGRGKGKVINLGLIYEMQAGTLAKNLGVSETVGEMYFEAWHKEYSEVAPYCRRQHAYARKYGYVRTITGRIRTINNIHSRDRYRRSLAEREASNTPCQGSVADVIKIAMRNFYWDTKKSGELFDIYTGKGRVKILSQVHDELIVEVRDDYVKEATELLIHHMEKPVELRVPMVADLEGVASNWLEACGKA